MAWVRTIAGRGGPIVAVIGLVLMAGGATYANASMVVQPDGKAVIAGATVQASPDCRAVDGHRRCGRFAFARPSVVRFLPSGDLDSTFGTDGSLVDFRWRMNVGFEALAVKPGGGIVSAVGGTDGFKLGGFDADGSPDLDFGSGGVATGPDLGSGYETPVDIAPLNGRLAVGGNSATSIKGTVNSLAALTFFDEDGQASEGASGFPGNKLLTDLTVQPSGALVASAYSLLSREAFLGRFAAGTSAFDPSFAGGKNFAALSFEGSSETAANAVVASGNSIVLAGTAQGRLLIARFSQDGVLDPSFGQGGIVLPTVDFSHGAEATDVAVLPDGKILVAGWSRDECSNPQTFNACRNVVAGRLNPDGSVDATFANGGFAHFSTPNQGFDTPKDIDLALLPDGNVLVADAPTVPRSADAPAQSFVLYRLTASGSLDPSFGEGGIAMALPCQGTIAARRHGGCLATARARLRLGGVQSSAPHLRLRVSENQRLDPIQAVRLLLPHGVRVRTSASDRVEVVSVGGKDTEPKLFPRSITVNRMGMPHAVVLMLRRGLLAAATGSGALPRKLVFRVKVRFRDGTTQTLRVVHRG